MSGSNTAGLSFQIDSSQAAQAAAQLNAMSQAAAGATSSTKQLAQAQDTNGQAIRQHTRELTGSADATSQLNFGYKQLARTLYDSSNNIVELSTRLKQQQDLLNSSVISINAYAASFQQLKNVGALIGQSADALQRYTTASAALHIGADAAVVSQQRFAAALDNTTAAGRQVRDVLAQIGVSMQGLGAGDTAQLLQRAVAAFQGQSPSASTTRQFQTVFGNVDPGSMNTMMNPTYVSMATRRQRAMEEDSTTRLAQSTDAVNVMQRQNTFRNATLADGQSEYGSIFSMGSVNGMNSRMLQRMGPNSNLARFGANSDAGQVDMINWMNANPDSADASSSRGPIGNAKRYFQTSNDTLPYQTRYAANSGQRAMDQSMIDEMFSQDQSQAGFSDFYQPGWKSLQRQMTFSKSGQDAVRADYEKNYKQNAPPESPYEKLQRQINNQAGLAKYGDAGLVDYTSAQAGLLALGGKDALSDFTTAYDGSGMAPGTGARHMQTAQANLQRQAQQALDPTASSQNKLNETTMSVAAAMDAIGKGAAAVEDAVTYQRAYREAILKSNDTVQAGVIGENAMREAQTQRQAANATELEQMRNQTADGAAMGALSGIANPGQRAAAQQALRINQAAVAANRGNQQSISGYTTEANASVAQNLLNDVGGANAKMGDQLAIEQKINALVLSGTTTRERATQIIQQQIDDATKLAQIQQTGDTDRIAAMERLQAAARGLRDGLLEAARVQFATSFAANSAQDVNTNTALMNMSPGSRALGGQYLGAARQMGATDPSLMRGPASIGSFQSAIRGVESGNSQTGRNGSVLINGAGGPVGDQPVGISQIKPSTAREVAAKNGITFDLNRLYTDSAYNQQLGDLYAQQMLTQFPGDGSLAAAAYNDGPGNIEAALTSAKISRTTPGAFGIIAPKLPDETQNYIGKMASRGGLGALVSGSQQIAALSTGADGPRRMVGSAVLNSYNSTNALASQRSAEGSALTLGGIRTVGAITATGNTGLAGIAQAGVITNPEDPLAQQDANQRQAAARASLTVEQNTAMAGLDRSIKSTASETTAYTAALTGNHAALAIFITDQKVLHDTQVLALDPQQKLIAVGLRLTESVTDQTDKIAQQRVTMHQSTEDTKALAEAWKTGAGAVVEAQDKIKLDAMDREISAQADAMKHYGVNTTEAAAAMAKLVEQRNGYVKGVAEQNAADAAMALSRQKNSNVNSDQMNQAVVDAGPFASNLALGNATGAVRARQYAAANLIKDPKDIADLIASSQNTDHIKLMADQVTNLRNSFASMGAAVEDSFSAISMGGQNSASVLHNLESQIERIAISAAFKPLEQGLSAGASDIFSGGLGLLGKLFGGSAAASGMAFGDGGHRYMSAGGVLDRPTRFMSAGGTVTGGEISSEGLLPLRRLANGDLGVQSGGKAASGHTINISAPISVQGGQGSNGKMDPAAMAALQKQFGQMIYTSVKGILTDEQRPGGALFGG